MGHYLHIQKDNIQNIFFSVLPWFNIHRDTMSTFSLILENIFLEDMFCTAILKL